MHSWTWIVSWNMDLCLSVCILMWSYELVMYCKLGACSKCLIYIMHLMFVAKLTCGLKVVFNVGVFN